MEKPNMNRRSFLKSGLLWLPSVALANAASPLLTRRSNSDGPKNPFPDVCSHYTFGTYDVSDGFIDSKGVSYSLANFYNSYPATGINGNCVLFQGNGLLRWWFAGADQPELNYNSNGWSKTVSFWIKPTLAGVYWLLSYRSYTCGPALLVTTDNSTGTYITYSWIGWGLPPDYPWVLQTVNASITPINEWYHLVVIADNDTKSLTTYCNGVVQSGGYATFPAGKTFSENQAYSIAIGCDPGEGSRYHGYFDEFCWWKRALTKSEVLYLFNSGAGRFL